LAHGQFSGYSDRGEKKWGNFLDTGVVLGYIHNTYFQNLDKKKVFIAPMRLEVLNPAMAAKFSLTIE
jgi:hypothetical protein